jgi:hypothetical protein
MDEEHFMADVYDNPFSLLNVDNPFKTSVFTRLFQISIPVFILTRLVIHRHFDGHPPA